MYYIHVYRHMVLHRVFINIFMCGLTDHIHTYNTCSCFLYSAKRGLLFRESNHRLLYRAKEGLTYWDPTNRLLYRDSFAKEGLSYREPTNCIHLHTHTHTHSLPYTSLNSLPHTFPQPPCHAHGEQRAV